MCLPLTRTLFWVCPILLDCRFCQHMCALSTIKCGASHANSIVKLPCLCRLLLIRHAVTLCHDSTIASSKCVGVRSLEHSFISSRCLNRCRVAAGAAAAHKCPPRLIEIHANVAHLLHVVHSTITALLGSLSALPAVYCGSDAARSCRRHTCVGVYCGASPPLAAASAKLMLGEGVLCCDSRPWSWLVGSRHPPQPQGNTTARFSGLSEAGGTMQSDCAHTQKYCCYCCYTKHNSVPQTQDRHTD